MTGNVSAGHAKPQGVYGLKYKQMNTVLKGPDYAVPVTFWMPLMGGLGCMMQAGEACLEEVSMTQTVLMAALICPIM